MLFLQAVGLNWGGFLLWCWSPRTKRHIRPLSTFSRFTFFRLTEECWHPTCCEPQTLFTQDPAIANSCKESDAGNKKRNYLIFFTFLYLVLTVSLLNHRQTLIQLKTQALFKFCCCLLLFSPKISTNRKPFCYDSDKCWALRSVESSTWKFGIIFSQILHHVHIQRY